MVRFVAVIDLGKTNSKVALVDTVTCTEIQIVKQPTSIRSDSLYPCIDHLGIETFIFNALRELGAAHSIDAITVTTHGATAALVKKSGELALPVMDYEFTDLDDLRDEYNRHRPMFAETGSPALPGGLNIGAQLFWQEHKYPNQFKEAAFVLTWPQYWIFRLTGQAHNDVTSLGCHTDLYVPEKKCYSTLIEQQHWGALLPPTKRSGEPSGKLRSSITEELKLSPNIVAHTGIHDSNASLVPHLLAQPAPFSVVSTGTWFISMAIGGARTQLDESRDTLINVNASGECVPSARFMGGRERDLLNLSEPVSDQAMMELLNLPAELPMLMPSTVTDTGPYPRSKKCWVGMDVQHDSSLKECAVTLYLALMTHECLLLIGADGPTYVEGPLAQDKAFVEMLAAATDRPLYTSNTETGTSIGASMLVSPPATLPEYTVIETDSMKREKLKRYAIKWQAQLARHVKN